MGRFWRIQTYFGSLVGHDAQSGQVVSVLPSARRPDFPLLLAYIPEARSDSCFLFSERGGRFWMGAAAEPVDVIGAGLARLACGKIALYDAGSGLWASGLPPGEDPPHLGGVTFTRTVIDDWEQLQLVAVPPGEIPADAARRAGAIEAMLVRPLDLAIIDATAEQDAAALQAVARLAPSHHLEALAASLIASPRAGRSLARLFPEDGLAVTALPALADWVAARDGGQAPGNEAPQSLGAEYDFLTTLGHDGATPSLAYACTALARRSILPRRDLCIVAIARNEGIYLLDWLAYHRAIGVQDVFLYTNDNDDGSDLLLAALARAGAIRWIRNEVGSGNCAQPKAYGHALAVRPETLDYRWALVIDLDELFVPNPALFRSALDFLRWHEAGPCDAIAVNWIFHGPGQAARWREDFVARRFPHPTGPVDHHIKSIVRPSAVLYSTPHCPLPSGHQPIRFHASDGQPHVASSVTNMLAHSDRPTAQYAWINHYFYKSSEEFLWKFARNRGNGPRQPHLGNRTIPANFVRAFMETFDSKHEALAQPEAIATGFETERARLMALPGVAEAWSHVKQCFAEQVAAMLPAFVNAPGIVQAGEAGVAFLETLGMTPLELAPLEFTPLRVAGRNAAVEPALLAVV